MPDRQQTEDNTHPRLRPLDAAAASRDPSLAAALVEIETAMGFVPHDCLAMAHRPELFHAMHGLVIAAYRPGAVGMELKRLVGLMSSQAAGCRYCSAHADFGARRAGVDDAKLGALWSYGDSPHFTAAERAALAVARGAAVTPNAVTDQDFIALREHFDDGEIVEILAVIGLFGFLNRWNATAGTRLEAAVLSSVTGGSP